MTSSLASRIGSYLGRMSLTRYGALDMTAVRCGTGGPASRRPAPYPGRTPSLGRKFQAREIAERNGVAESPLERKFQHIAARRRDEEFRTRLRRSLEENRDILERLAQ